MNWIEHTLLHSELVIGHWSLHTLHRLSHSELVIVIGNQPVLVSEYLPAPKKEIMKRKILFLKTVKTINR